MSAKATNTHTKPHTMITFQLQWAKMPTHLKQNSQRRRLLTSAHEAPPSKWSSSTTEKSTTKLQYQVVITLILTYQIMAREKEAKFWINQVMLKAVLQFRRRIFSHRALSSRYIQRGQSKRPKMTEKFRKLLWSWTISKSPKSHKTTSTQRKRTCWLQANRLWEIILIKLEQRKSPISKIITSPYCHSSVQKPPILPQDDGPKSPRSSVGWI